jgi:hypothetical protein
MNSFRLRGVAVGLVLMLSVSLGLSGCSSSQLPYGCHRVGSHGSVHCVSQRPPGNP